MKKLALLLFMIGAGTLCAQNNYIASASTTALTLQQPATDSKTVEFPSGGRAGASVFCAGAQTATVKWNGSAATATTGTANAVPPSTLPASATVWTASNVGAGTTAVIAQVAAGATISLDLGWFKMGGAGTANNITIATSGTCTITFMWSERQ